MDRYCVICEKKVKQYFEINEGGIRSFKGECGHISPITEVETKKESPTFIVKCDGFCGKSEVY